VGSPAKLTSNEQTGAARLAEFAANDRRCACRRQMGGWFRKEIKEAVDFNGLS
jgi:TRAP-type mannitol/chloroaromatic compound transport system substrate-binding protein